jgi:quercetin dioxygenase-like cupin family protein
MTPHIAARQEIDQKTATDMFWFGNTLVALRARASASEDGVSIVEHWMPHGEAPPLHIHQSEDEYFHVLDGVMRFEVGGKTIIASAGDTLTAPKGVPHRFRVDSMHGARCLTITRGGDFESMLIEMGRPAASEDLPPQQPPTPEMIAALTEACRRARIDIIGPPLV